MKKTRITKTISVVLTLIMTFVSYIAMPAKALAEEAKHAALAESIGEYTDANDFSQGNTLSYSPLKGELAEERDESVKVFRRADGAQEAVVYSDPVHYLKDEAWETIDNTLELVTLEDGTQAYRNKANDFIVSFSPSFHTNNLITVESKGHIVSWRFAEEVPFAHEEPAYETLQITDAKAEIAEREQKEPETDEERDMQLRFPEELTSELTYQDPETGLNVHYVLSGKRLSEQIVLDHAPENAIAYSTLLSTNGLKAEEKEGRIIFVDESGEAIFEIMSPVMYDASGEESMDIEVQLIETEGGYAYTLIPDMAWLADKTREYPVTVDPDIKIIKTASEAGIKDTYVDSSYPNTNYGSLGYIWVNDAGGQRQIYSLVKTNALPTLKSGDIILEAGIYYAKYDVDTNAPIVVSGYRVTEDWADTTATYNNLPTYGSDPVTVAATMYMNRYSEFDITSTVKSWYENPSSNHGILLKGNNYTKFISANASTSLPPYLSVIYRNSTGLESNWTYYSQSAGRAGTGSVNLASGNLTWTMSDGGITNGVLPISLSHVYNVNDIGSDLGYGRGWRLNYAQTLKRFPVTNGNETALYYEYTDGDGTRHYYKEQDGEFVNELDKNSKLTFSENDTVATIEDKGDNKLVFEIFSSGSGADLVQNGRLIRIEDANGNKTLITYLNPTGWSLRISKITEQLSGQSAGQELTLAYNVSNLLQSISAPNELNVTFTYSSVNDLLGAAYTDSNTVSFEYTNHCLTKATNIDGYNLRYAYNEKKAVTGVREYAGSTAGQGLAFTYGRSKAVVTDDQDRKTIYTQDSLGQPLSVTDPEGRAMFAAYNTGEQTVTQLSAVSKLQNSVINLLSNHGFESSSSALTNWTASDASKITVDSSNRREGFRCAKFLNSSAALTLSQTVSVESGKTYTLSAWFKGAGSAQVKAATGTSTFTGDPVTVNGDDWTRATVTFTATASTAVVQLAVPANNGLIRADSVQLEESETPSRYNMLENSDFENGVTGWARNYTNYNNTGSLANAAYAPYASNHPAAFGSHIYCFNHAAHTGDFADEFISQTMYVDGQAGDTYSFGGWLMSTCPPRSEQRIDGYNVPVGQKSITVEFLAANGAVTASSTMIFAADTTEWQYACGVAVATHSYSSIRIKVNATRCIGVTLVDGLQLYRESFSQAYSYDSNGNLTGYTTLIGQQNSFDYDGNDNVTSSTDPRGNETTYTYYDGTHLLKTVETEEGVKTAYVYNGKGQTTETTVGDTSSLYTGSTAAYDAATGQTASATDARGNTVAYTYDPDTRANTTVTDPLNRTATYVYGNAAAMHRLASMTSSGLGTVEYGYDAYGNLETITRGTTVYRLTYDAWNRPEETKVGTTALSTNTYDAYGKLIAAKYANGFGARYEYDGLDRVVRIEQCENVNATNPTYILTYQMIYNGEGDLYEIRNYRTGRASFFDYDHAGRCMASRERAFTVTNGVIAYGTELSAYGYRYDECNNLTKLTCSVLGSTWSTIYTYDGDNRASTTTLASGKVLTNTYDAIGRLQKRTLKQGNTTIHETALTYISGNATNKTTGLVATYQNGSDAAYSYTYDAVGNITAITQGTTSISYEYDAANRLTRENNQVTNQTVTCEYDTWGNILNKKIYAYTTGTLGTPSSTVYYAYTNTAWGDQLTSYAGQTITYDSMGNPLTYRGYTFGWRGKQLVSASNGTNTLAFEYNEDGLRQKKTVNNVVTDYFYNGSVLIGMQRGSTKYLFSYDAAGNVVSVKQGTNEYYYLRNAQGDIVKLIDGSGAAVVEYTYDTWGKKVTTTGSLASTLGLIQPFRYRGYVYDFETGFYYLQSRYYDPTTGRFVSADVLLSTGQGVMGHNCYAYCLDNPVNGSDPSGLWFIWGGGGNKENSEDGSGGVYSGGTNIFVPRSYENPYRSTREPTYEIIGNYTYDVNGEVITFENSTYEGFRFDSNQQATIEIAKEFSKGIHEDDAEILIEWALEYGLNARGPEIHISRSGWASTHWHIHVGPLNHILVLGR